MREAARNLAIFTTFTALLAGIGFQALIDVTSGKLNLSGPWRRYGWVATVFGLIIFGIALAVDRPARLTGLLVLAVVPLAFLLMRVASRRQRLVATALILLACLASILSPTGTLPFSVSEYVRKDNLVSHRVLRRVAQLPDIANYRVAILDSDFRPMTWADNASFYGIRTFYFMFTPVPIPQFKEMLDETPNMRKLRGAKYFICGPKADPPDANAQLLFTESGYRVYEVADPMDQFALVHMIKAFPNATSFRATVVKGFDYRHIGGVLRLPGQQFPTLLQILHRRGTTEIAPNELEPIIRTPNLFGIVTDSAHPGLLILNERWNEDWHARVDSHPTKVMQANFVQPAVALPAGRHYVEFEYKPMLFWYLRILQRIMFLLSWRLRFRGCWCGAALVRTIPAKVTCDIQGRR